MLNKESKMKKTQKKTLKKFIALFINLQFILPTSGFAMNTGKVTSTILNTANQIGGAYDFEIIFQYL